MAHINSTDSNMSPKFEAIFHNIKATGGDVAACNLDSLTQEECSSLLALTYLKLDEVDAIVDASEATQEEYDEAFHSQWCYENLAGALSKILA